MTMIDFDLLGSEIPYRPVHETGFTQKMLLQLQTWNGKIKFLHLYL